MADMTFSIGGVTIPKPTTFVRRDDGNYSARRVIEGALKVDFRERLRSWTVGWNLILVDSDFQSIHDLWTAQFDTRTFPTMVFTEYGINGEVFIEISDQNIRYNGILIESFSLTITEIDPATTGS